MKVLFNAETMNFEAHDSGAEHKQLKAAGWRFRRDYTGTDDHFWYTPDKDKIVQARAGDDMSPFARAYYFNPEAINYADDAIHGDFIFNISTGGVRGSQCRAEYRMSKNFDIYSIPSVERNILSNILYTNILDDRLLDTSRVVIRFNNAGRNGITVDFQQRNHVNEADFIGRLSVVKPKTTSSSRSYYDCDGESPEATEARYKFREEQDEIKRQQIIVDHADLERRLNAIRDAILANLHINFENDAS